MYFIYICISHIFFICSSVDGHLGCYCILDVANNAAMNSSFFFFPGSFT